MSKMTECLNALGLPYTTMEWKLIPDTDGNYFASDNGDIFSKPRPTTSGGLLSQFMRGDYLSVRLTINSKSKCEYVHRLVLSAFTNNVGNGLQACHANGSRLDNRSANLIWGTQRENESHKHAHGTAVFGSRAYNSKLTESDVLMIRRRHASGDSPKSIFNDFGISKPCGQNIIYRRSWKHVL